MNRRGFFSLLLTPLVVPFVAEIKRRRYLANEPTLQEAFESVARTLEDSLLQERIDYLKARGAFQSAALEIEDGDVRRVGELPGLADDLMQAALS